MGAPVLAGGVEFPVLHGLTLEQFAGITAALAEEFPLDAVLANEDIDAPAWRLAGPAWKAQIVEEAKGGGALLAAYREKLGEAEDCLRRRVTPLDEDMSAWIGFLGAWSAHPTPFDILAGFGLRMNDVSRLQRGWARRVEHDASLREKMAKLAEKKPSAPPIVSAEPASLKPFPWSAKREPTETSEPRTGADASVEVGGLAVDQYAALAAELAAFPAEVERVIAKYGVARAALPALEQRWKRWTDDPDLHRDWRRLYAHHLGRLRGAAKESSAGERPLVSTSPVLAAVPTEDLGGTSQSLEFPRGPALPFVEPRADRIEMAEARRPPSPVSAELGGTSLLVEFPRGPALPFAGEPAVVASAPPARQGVPRSPEALVETGLEVAFPRGPALPFVKGEALNLERPPAEQGPLNPRDTLTGTSLALDFPRGSRPLPFANEAPVAKEEEALADTALDLDFSSGSALPVPRGALARPAVPIRLRQLPPTEPPPVMLPPEDLGGTSLALEFPRGPVVPFAKPAAAAPAPPPPVAPSASRQAVALTLEQHASLSVELALAPERTAETLTRYRLTSEAKALADHHFQVRTAQDPAARAAWDRAYKTYHAWVMTNRRHSR